LPALRAWLAWFAGFALGVCVGLPAQAQSSRFCDQRRELNASTKDHLLRFSAAVKDALDASDRPLALVSRSGLDLSRFHVRYSHAGIALKHSPNTPWSVRQLYYACDEDKPRLFDEGMAGFVLGTDDPALGFVSVVLLPPGADSRALERAALDNASALRLLGADYSANAYAFSTRYQNCNQWLIELLATAWNPVPPEPGGTQRARAQAQAWLQAQGYEPSEFHALWMMGLGAFIPWIHNDDHPRADVANRVYRTSMPAAIEDFVQRHVPGATRLEFCHTASHIVVHRGWDALADDCSAGAGDTVVPLD
jgi:hypothetical protein